MVAFLALLAPLLPLIKDLLLPLVGELFKVLLTPKKEIVHEVSSIDVPNFNVYMQPPRL